MSRLYSLIFKRQFSLAKATRFLFAKLRPSRPNAPAWRDQPNFAEFDKKEFDETRVFEPREFDVSPARKLPHVEVTEDALDTLPADLQDEFVRSVGRATLQGVDKEPKPPS
jgi:hypothetical protein